MGFGGWRGLALALVLTMIGGGAAGAPSSPLWSSDQVRAARPLGEAEALVLDVRSEHTRKDQPARVSMRTVTLAPSFSLLAEGTQRILEDHDLCRTLTWTDGEPRVDNESCYGLVAVRVFELQNRVALAEILAKTTALPPEQFLGFAETELGMATPGPDRLTARKTAAGTEYRLGDVVMARVTGDLGPASPEEMKRVGRFLARYANVHPQVRRGIVAGGRLPALIETEIGPTRAEDGRQVITLSNPRRTKAAYPLPAGLTSTLAELARAGGSKQAEAVASAEAAIAGRRVKPSLQTLTAALRKAVAAGQTQQALLIFLEITQEQASALKPGGSGDNSALVELRSIMPKVMTAPDVVRFWQASNLAAAPNDADGRAAAAKYLAGATAMDAMAFGTFRYVTYANLVRGAKEPANWAPGARAGMPAQLVDNYWIHIAAYPWSANTYKDAGDTILGDYDGLGAWLAYDLGRAVDPDWRTGPMSALGKFEDSLREREPDFF